MRSLSGVRAIEEEDGEQDQSCVADQVGSEKTVQPYPGCDWAGMTGLGRREKDADDEQDESKQQHNADEAWKPWHSI